MTLVIFLTLACSFTSTSSQPTSKETSPAIQINDITPEAAKQTVKSDDGFRFPINGCGLNYGYINQQGDLIIAHQFEKAGFFHEGLAVVGLVSKMNPETFKFEEGKYGYIDISGNFVIEPIFPEAASFSEGLAAAASPDDPNLYGFIDKTGQFVIEPQYFGSLPSFKQQSPSFKDFHEGYAVVPKPRITTVDEYMFMYIDHEGNILTPPGPVKNATYFSDGLAIVQTISFETNIINKNGQVIAQVNDCSFNNCFVEAFSEGLAPIKKSWSNPALTGYIDKSGKVVIAEQFEDAEAFSEGLAAVQDAETQLWGYINQSGTLIVPYQYTTAGDFSEGLAPVALPDGNGGYIDTKGNFVLPFEGVTVIPDLNLTTPFYGNMFHDGLALVGNGYIDKNGKFVYKIESEGCP